MLSVAAVPGGTAAAYRKKSNSDQPETIAAKAPKHKEKMFTNN